MDWLEILRHGLFIYFYSFKKKEKKKVFFRNSVFQGLLVESVIISQSQKHYILASQNDLVCSSLSHNCMSLEPCADSGAADGTGPREGAGVHVGGAGQSAAQGRVRGGLGPGHRPIRGCSGAPPSGGG